MGNTFMGDAPIMSGHWYCPNTGDSFTVRDTYFEDNNLYVVTMDGRRLDYNMIQQYVQTDKPMPKRPVDNGLPAKSSNLIDGLPPEVASLLSEDTALTSKAPNTNVTTNISAPTVSQIEQTVVKPVIEDEDALMIRKMLSRGASPEISSCIVWNKYPVKQMEMLIEYMGIEPEKIAEYYINNINLNDIKKSLSDKIIEYILSKGDSGCADNKEQQVIDIKKSELSAEQKAEQKGEKYYLDENGQVKLTQTGLVTAPSTISQKQKTEAKKPVEKKKPVAKKKPVVKKK